MNARLSSVVGFLLTATFLPCLLWAMFGQPLAVVLWLLACVAYLVAESAGRGERSPDLPPHALVPGDDVDGIARRIHRQMRVDGLIGDRSMHTHATDRRRVS